MRQLNKLLLTIFFIFVAVYSHADTVTHGFTIPTAHPRLLWNASRIAQAQSWLTAHPFTPNSDDYLNVAWKHVVANTDCSSAITYAMNMEVPTGEYSPSGNGADYARWNGETVILIYDWCYDQLTTQQKSDFLNNIASSGKGWNDYLAGINQQGWGGPAMTDSNYNWGNLRNDIEYGIATYTENTTFAETVLDDGIDTRWTQYFVPAALLPKLVGGVPGEGDAYGTSIMSSAMVPFLSMGLLGRDIFSESGFFKQFIYYEIYATTPAPTHPVNSGNSWYYVQPYGDDEQFVDGGMLHIRTANQDIMNFFSNYFSTINIGKDARQWVNTVGADAGTKATSNWILAQDLSPSARATSNLPLDYYASGIQFLYGRKAWDTSSAYFFLQMDRGTEHSHQDFGNFHIWRGGRWLTRETVGYSNTITGYGYKSLASSGADVALAHNVVVFGTLLKWDQSDLLPITSFGRPIVKRLESASGYSYADVDLTKEYWDQGYVPPYGGSWDMGAVVHIEREFLFLRNLETTVILDRITTGDVVRGVDTGVSAANEVNTFLLHSEVDPTLEDATHVTITNGDQVLRMTTLVPANPTRRVINEQDCTGCSAGIGQYRIELDTSGAAQRYFLNVLQARTNTDADLTASVVDSNAGDPTSGTFTVTLHPATGSDTTIVFNKGQTVSGTETVNLAGAGVTNIKTSVQGITYTDNGPVWDGQSGGSTTITGKLGSGWKGLVVK